MQVRMAEWIKNLQSNIVASLTALDPDHPFTIDQWQRTEGGEGISCVLNSGSVFEKAGVNVSIVHGVLTEGMAREMRARGKHDVGGGMSFFAAGISLVVHPVNPMAPTVHLNYRYFEVQNKSGDIISWWFGGGSDLVITSSYYYYPYPNSYHYYYFFLRKNKTHSF